VITIMGNEKRKKILYNRVYHSDVCLSVSMFHTNLLLPSQRTDTYL
jgi:hypothetical protein